MPPPSNRYFSSITVWQICLPFPHLKAVQNGFDNRLWWQLRRTSLEEKYVGVNHGPAEVALNVGHCLTLDLQSVSHPQATHDLVESSLEK